MSDPCANCGDPIFEAVPPWTPGWFHVATGHRWCRFEFDDQDKAIVPDERTGMARPVEHPVKLVDMADELAAAVEEDPSTYVTLSGVGRLARYHEEVTLRRGQSVAVEVEGDGLGVRAMFAGQPGLPVGVAIEDCEVEVALVIRWPSST